MAGGAICDSNSLSTCTAVDCGNADEEQGEVWFGALAWSGNWKFIAETTDFSMTRLSLGLNGTLQDPKWTDHNLKTQTLSTGQVVAFDEHGLTPERTPKIAGKLMASYQFAATEFGRFAVNGSYQYTGTRPVDRANGPINPLTSYGEVQVGASWATKQGFTVRLTVNNLFDGKGLSEGDPRGGTNVLDPTVSVFNARPIQPRTITGSVSYRF